MPAPAMRPVFLVVAIAAATGCAGAQTGGLPPGQPMPSLPAASWIAGELTPEAPRLIDSTFVHEYTLDSDGSPFEVRLVSPEFDTFLLLISPSRSVFSNDDYGGAWGESRIAVPADTAEAGTWTVQVNTLRPGEIGAYTLTQRSLEPVPPEAQAVGGWVGGALTGDSPLLQDSTHAYAVDLVSDGAPFEVRLTSFDFDPYLIVVSPGGSRYENDDYGGSIRESRVVIPPDSAEAGIWQVYANTYVPGSTGEFTLVHRPLAAAALAAYSRELDEARVRETSAEVARLYDSGRYAEAEPLARDLAALVAEVYGTPTPEAAEAHLMLARVLSAAGDPGAADALYRAAETAWAAFDPASPDLAAFFDRAGTAAYLAGDYEAAEQYYSAALRTLPPIQVERVDSGIPSDPAPPPPSEPASDLAAPTSAVVLYNLATAQEAQNRLGAAASLYEEALAIEEGAYGTDDPEVAVTLLALGSVRQRLGDLDGARDLYRRAAAIYEAASGEAGGARAGGAASGAVDARTALARLEAEAGRFAEARAHYERAIATQEAALGDDHPATALLVNAVGEIVQLQAFADARPLYERALDAQAAALGDDHEATVRTRNNLARLVTAQEDLLAGAPPTRSRGPRGREAPSPLVRQGLDRAILFATDAYADTTGTWADLSNPIRDAEAIAAELRDRYGFDTLVVRNPTRTDILDVLRDARRTEVPENSQLFVFFAGHGTVDGDGERDPGYYIPADGGDRPSADWVNYDNIAGELGRMPDRRVLAVFDACRGGSFFKERRSQASGDEPLPPSRVVAEYARYASRLAITSGARDQDVSDGAAGENSPFAFQLLSALRGGGAPAGSAERDGLLLFNEVLTYATPIGGQSPLAGDFGYGHEAGGTFFFLDSARAQAHEARLASGAE